MQRRRGGRQTVVVALRMAHHVLHLVQHGLPVRRNGLHEREQVRHAHVVHCGGIEVGRVGHAGQGGVAAVAGAVDADAVLVRHALRPGRKHRSAHRAAAPPSAAHAPGARAGSSGSHAAGAHRAP
ncbi:hypothetical protein G6F59_016110 [Rhizopus arrhizus]|nr:hypothetical protein G6F59_016110 [Rhizopus arrhizus]